MVQEVEALENREYTLAEVAELNREGKPYELVHGKLVRLYWWARQAGLLPRLCSIFDQYLDSNPIGELYLRLGFILERTLPTLRILALSFVSKQSLLVEGEEKSEAGYWEFAPDLVVDITTPSDSLYAVFEKAADYIRLGVKEVWLIV